MGSHELSGSGRHAAMQSHHGLSLITTGGGTGCVVVQNTNTKALNHRSPAHRTRGIRIHSHALNTINVVDMPALGSSEIPRFQILHTHRTGLVTQYGRRKVKLTLQLFFEMLDPLFELRVPLFELRVPLFELRVRGRRCTSRLVHDGSVTTTKTDPTIHFKDRFENYSSRTIPIVDTMDLATLRSVPSPKNAQHSMTSKPRCSYEDCPKPQTGTGHRPDRCSAHNSGRQCEEPGCTRTALFSHRLDRSSRHCFEHGGGDTCRHPGGCTNFAAPPRNRRTSFLCSDHGGIQLCTSDGCKFMARPSTTSRPSDRCFRHGGGNVCNNPHCNNESVSLVTGRCEQHGGSTCTFPDGCRDKAEPTTQPGRRSDRCFHHGGGIACLVPGCSAFVIDRNTVTCRDHTMTCTLRPCKMRAIPSTTGRRHDRCIKHDGGDKCDGDAKCFKQPTLIIDNRYFCASHGGRLAVADPYLVEAMP